MDLQEFKAQYYFFDQNNFGKVYIFVDFGNVRPWAKELWPEENKFRFCVEIDIKKLAGICNWVNPEAKIFYFGYFAQDENADADHINNKKHRDSIFRIDKARKAGFSVKTKEIKMIPQYNEDGKFLGKFPKCNFDVEIAMDLLLKIKNYDTVMLFSGDSDFGGLMDYLKNNGKKIVVVCTRNRMSKELERIATKFIPAETLANFLKFEKPYKNKHSAQEGGGVNTI